VQVALNDVDIVLQLMNAFESYRARTAHHPNHMIAFADQIFG
jgi:hypothetical protein